MTNTTQEFTRHLPASHARRMAELAEAPRVFDGRSQRWVEKLVETQFAECEMTNDKKRTTIKVWLTNRGKIALERDQRGVDPYLIMT